jgi:hypothetical protein
MGMHRRGVARGDEPATDNGDFHGGSHVGFETGVVNNGV